MSEKITVKVDPDYKEIIPAFLDNRHKDIKDIDSYLEGPDLKAIEIIAHKLAGNAGSYGFPELGSIGSEMEKACKEQNETGVKELYNKFCDYMKRLEVVYE